MSMSLSLGLAISGVGTSGGGGGAPGATWMAPTNYDAVGLGDSRTAYGGGLSVANPVPPVTNGTSNLHSVGWTSWIVGMTNGRVRPAIVNNYGQAGADIQSICSVARITDVAANPANIVVVLMGTNNAPSPTTIGVGGAGRTVFDAMIDVLTNPASTKWSVLGASGPIPLYNNVPKRILVLDELPRGIDRDGAVAGVAVAQANSLALKTFGEWAIGYAYNSGLPIANPYVAGVNVYSLFLDTSTGANLYNKVGLYKDGIHPNVAGAFVLTQALAARINTLIPGVGGDFLSQMPTTIANTSAISANPLMTGTTGSNSGLKSITGTPPTSWNVLGSNATNVDVTVTTEALGGNKGSAMVITLSGTAAAAGKIELRQSGTINSSTLAFGTDRLRAVANVAYSVPTGLANSMVRITAFITAANSIYSYTVGTGDDSNLDFLNNGNDTSHDYLVLMTDLADFTNAGSTTASSGRFSIFIEFGIGNVGGTYKIGQAGYVKVAN